MYDTNLIYSVVVFENKHQFIDWQHSVDVQIVQIQSIPMKVKFGEGFRDEFYISVVYVKEKK